MSTIEKPLVSVGIPTYNRVDWLKGAIDSVLNQNYSNIDIVVCDNASTDGTEKFMQEYCDKYKNIKYYRNESNMGGFYNYKKLSEKLKGKYIFFLPDDDYLLDGAFFQEAVEMMEKNEKISLVRGIVQDYNTSSNSISTTTYQYRKIVEGCEYFLNYAKTGTEHIQGFFALMRKKSFDEVGGIDEVCFLDMVLYLKLFLVGDVAFINRLVGGMRHRAEPYPLNFFLKKEFVIKNLEILRSIKEIALLKNNFTVEDLNKWEKRLQIGSLIGYDNYDLAHKSARDGLEYIKKYDYQLYKYIVKKNYIKQYIELPMKKIFQRVKKILE